MDIRLAYTERGEGFPLLLLHGNGESSAYFQGQMEPLARVRRVIAVDTRGHGVSSRGEMPFTLSQFTDDLRAFMDVQQIPKADILGFSDGGNIALLFALRYPARVRRLIVNGANLFPSGMKLPSFLMIWLVYGFTACTARLFRRGVRIHALYRLMAREPHIRPEELARLTMPVLVVVGSHDMIREKHTRLIASSLPHGRLAVLAGGHTVALDRPEAFNETVLAFLAEAPDQPDPESGATLQAEPASDCAP